MSLTVETLQGLLGLEILGSDGGPCSKNPHELTLFPNGLGVVGIKDVGGSESLIAQVARVSTGSESKGPQADQKLVKYLYDHKHTSPLEIANITFFLHIPLYIAVEILRHRTGKFSMLSQRFQSMKDASAYIPGKFRKQSSSNLQCSTDEPVEDQYSCEQFYMKSLAASIGYYERLIELGCCREQARGVLPYGIYTSLYVQFDLNNLIKFFHLRLAANAQKEMNWIAESMLRQGKEYFPTLLGMVS